MLFSVAVFGRSRTRSFLIGLEWYLQWAEYFYMWNLDLHSFTRPHISCVTFLIESMVITI